MIAASHVRESSPAVTTMPVARAYPGEQLFRMEEAAVPTPGAGEVVLRVRAASVTRGLLALWYFTQYIELPSVLGHEAAGDIAAVGPDVDHVREGDRAVLFSALTCGACRPCRSGEETLCEQLGIIGYGRYGGAEGDRYTRYKNGGLAEYVLAPATNVGRIPDGVSYDAAAKSGTIGGSLGAVRATGAGAGDTLAVVAATGAAGVAAVLCAPLVGVTRVVAVGRDRGLLERTVRLSRLTVETIATTELETGWADNDGLTSKLRTLAGSAGLAGVVDFTPLGLAETDQAIRALRAGGTAVLAGGNQVRVPVPYGQVMRNQWCIRGVRGTRRRDAEEALACVADGSIDVDALVTHTFTMAQVNDAVRIVHNREGAPLFVMIHP